MRKMNCGTLFESLENRRLLYASVPADYIKLETIHIRPKAATYASDLALTANTEYFLRATGEAYTSAKTYHGDTAFAAGTPVTKPAATSSSWGVSVTGAVSSEVTAWGAYQSDHIYEQRITPTTNGTLAFTFANDALVGVSTLAVTVYAPVSLVSVAKVRTNVAVGSVNLHALPGGGVTIPVNNADFDQNGISDNQQIGRVADDGFLLPITLPKVSGATTHAHYEVIAPKSFRVWLNADRTGSTVNVGIRERTARTVYLEARRALPAGVSQSVRIVEVYDGVGIEQDIPVTTFTFAGPTTSAVGSKKVYSVNTDAGGFDGAVNGSLTGSTIFHSNPAQYANVVWSNTPAVGYVDFRVNGSFIWGFPVSVTA